MHITLRRLIFILFVLIFLISAPLAVLHTAGYRLNISNRRLQQTGVLAVTSYPRGSNIILNGQALASKTPYVFQRIMPNQHEITLNKPGYHSWSQRIQVEAGRTSYIHARIFAASKPSTLSTIESALALRSKPAEPNSTQDVASVTFVNNQAAIEVHIGSNIAAEPIALLPIADYQVLEESADHILVRSNDQQAYLLSRNGDQVTSLSDNLTAFDWLANENLILWTDGAEVHIFDVASNQNTFITRQGEAVTDVAWHPAADSFFIVSGTSLLAFDRFIYETREIIQLMSDINTRDIWLDASGKNLYFIDLNELTGTEKTTLVSKLPLSL